MWIRDRFVPAGVSVAPEALHPRFPRYPQELVHNLASGRTELRITRLLMFSLEG